MWDQSKIQLEITQREITLVEAVSKPHLRPNGGVAPQAGFASDFLN
jgi:hypothetical protein